MDWFKNALINEGSTAHAIVILSHFDVKDPLVEVRLNDETLQARNLHIPPRIAQKGKPQATEHHPPPVQTLRQLSGPKIDTEYLQFFP